MEREQAEPGAPGRTEDLVRGLALEIAEEECVRGPVQPSELHVVPLHDKRFGILEHDPDLENAALAVQHRLGNLAPLRRQTGINDALGLVLTKYATGDLLQTPRVVGKQRPKIILDQGFLLNLVILPVQLGEQHEQRHEIDDKRKRKQVVLSDRPQDHGVSSCSAICAS